MKNLPALLGNSPVFENSIPFAKPVLPEFQGFANDLKPIFASGVLTKGAQLHRFEEMVAEYLGVTHAVALSNCTTGLMLTYRALGLTGEVVVPSFTFMATVGALVWANVKPVLVDVNRATGLLNTAAAEAAITDRTSAIVAVHNFGNPAEIEELKVIAERHHLKLVFDAAQAFGSMYKGSPVGAQGDAQVFSLSPTKLLVAGEGGIVATNDDAIAEKVRIGREYGNSGNYDSILVGLNGRMAEFNALLGQHSLRSVESAARHRNDVAALYQKGLRHLAGLEFQEVHPGNRSSYNIFSIMIDAEIFGLTRDELAQALAAENIDTRNYYDPPVHRQTAYRQFVTAGVDLFHTDLLAATTLCLPIWSNMGSSIVGDICLAIERAHEFAPEIRERLTSPGLALIS